MENRDEVMDELITLLLIQDKEIQRLKKKIQMIREYIETYEEYIKGE